MRKRHPGLEVLVRRVGRGEVARRLGVSESTVWDWMRYGVSSKRFDDVTAALARSDRAVRAAAVSKTYRDLGWKRFRSWDDVDEFIGAPDGHVRERWEHRKQWWEEHRPTERLPKKVAVVQDSQGRLLYVNGDAIVWRGYTVDGRLFWTLAQNLEGYDTVEQMKEMYESLLGRKVVLTW